jgi:hypothetical protein
VQSVDVCQVGFPEINLVQNFRDIRAATGRKIVDAADLLALRQ